MATPTASPTQGFLQCPGTFAIENRYAYATTALGTISFIVCSLAILIILGNSRDRRSLRDRILVGMFAGNIIFSFANMVPINVYNTSNDWLCGGLVTPPIRFAIVQGLFLCGKFIMIMYEIFIVGASIMALKTGRTSIPNVWIEIVIHFVCIFSGIICWITFSSQTYPYLKKAQTLVNYNTESAQISALEQIHNVTAVLLSFVRAWIPFLVILLVLWGYQRYVLHGLIRQWNVIAEESHSRWDRDLWNTTDTETMNVRQRKGRLLDTIKEGYLEIAKPLEPYVAVFIVFSTPAIVMATPFCENFNQSWQTYSSLGRCDPIAIMVLSIRALAASTVFMWDRENRLALLHIPQLLNNCWQRLKYVSGTSVGRIRFDTYSQSVHDDDLKMPITTHEYENNNCYSQSSLE